MPRRITWTARPLIAATLACLPACQSVNLRGTLPAKLSPQEQAAGLRLAYAAIDPGNDPLTLLEDEQVLARSSLRYSWVHIGLVSPSHGVIATGAAPPRVAGSGLADDILAATGQALASAGDGLSPAELRVVLDVLGERQAVRSRTDDSLKRQIELGQHGLELSRQGRRWILPPWMSIRYQDSAPSAVQRLCRKAGFSPTAYLNAGTSLATLAGASFTGDRDGTVVTLSRGRPFLRPEDVTVPLVWQRLLLAGDWFLAHADAATGLLAYQYRPDNDSYPRAKDNHIRRLGGTWAMARLANATDQHDAFDPIIQRTLEHYLRQGVPTKKGGICIPVEGRANIAYNAFLIFILTEWGRAPESERLITELARGLVEQQNADGSFRTHFGRPGTTSGIDYFPGEAVLSLLHAYRAVGDPAYLAAAERAFPYYRHYWRSHPTSAFIPWHAQANLLLYEATGRAEYASFTFEMADWLNARQVRNPDWPDELGGFAVGHRREMTNSSASFLEGINAAYRLARMVNDRPHSQRFAKTIRLGARFVLGTQLTEEGALLSSNPPRAIGGFTRSLIKTLQRNDYTQHAVMALLAALDNGLIPDAPGESTPAAVP